MARSRAAASNVKRRRPAGRIAVAPDYRLIDRLGGGALVVIAALTVLSLALGDGGVARNWNALLRLGFGWGANLVPLCLAAFGLALLWPIVQPGYRLQRREAAGWLLVFGFGVTLAQLLAGDPPPGGDFTAGGGYAGQSAVGFLKWLIGPGGAYGVAAAAGLIGVVLTFGIGPRELRDSLLLVLAALLWLGRQGIKLLWLLGAALRRGWLELIIARRRKQAARAEQTPHFRINRPEAAAAPPADSSTPAPTPERAAPGSGFRILGPKTRKPASDGVEDGKVLAPVATGTPAAGDVPKKWQLPPLTFLDAGGEGEPSEADLRQKVNVIEETLADFGIKARVLEVNPGPVVTQFGLDPGFRERRNRAGDVVRRDKVKVSEITTLRDDLALALAARTVRIEAPVPGRAVIGLEIPNTTATVVHLRRVVESTAFQRVHTRSKLAVALGQDVSGGAVAADLAKMPHLLIAGATGSGKSVCMNTIIAGFLLHATPDDVRMIMIDPKRVELTSFRQVPHLLRSVVVDVEHAVTALKWTLREMELRLKRFEAHGVRNIEGYNRLMGSRDGKEAMPYIVLLIDELADLMMSAPDEVERSICRLAQLARATGIHLVIATQRPSVDVVTGLIKANFPTRISFAVASQVDSRTILDTVGAEQLLGSGDMLFMPADAAKPRRLQGAFLSDDEVKKVVDFWKSQGPPRYVSELETAAGWSKDEEDQSDPAYERAVEVARQYTRISISLLQRRLGVGHTRAARLIDLLEQRDVVGPAEGGKPREVLPFNGESGMVGKQLPEDVGIS